MATVALMEGLGGINKPSKYRTCLLKYKKNGKTLCSVQGKVPNPGRYFAPFVSQQIAAAIKKARKQGGPGTVAYLRREIPRLGGATTTKGVSFTQAKLIEVIKTAIGKRKAPTAKQRALWKTLTPPGGKKKGRGKGKGKGRVRQTAAVAKVSGRPISRVRSGEHFEDEYEMMGLGAAGRGRGRYVVKGKGARKVCYDKTTRKFAKRALCGLGSDSLGELSGKKRKSKKGKRGARAYFRGLDDVRTSTNLMGPPSDFVGFDRGEMVEEFSPALNRNVAMARSEREMPSNMGYYGLGFGGGGASWMPVVGMAAGGLVATGGLIAGKKLLPVTATKYAGLIGAGASGLIAGVLYMIRQTRSAALPAAVVGGLFGVSQFLMDMFLTGTGAPAASTTGGMGAIVAEDTDMYGLGAIVAEDTDMYGMGSPVEVMQGLGAGPGNVIEVLGAGDMDGLGDDDGVIDVVPSAFGTIPIAGLQ